MMAFIQRLQTMNGIYHYAPGAIITKFFDLDMAVFFVFGDECDAFDLCLQPTHQELAVDHGHDHFPAHGFDAAVYDEHIAMINAGADHGIAIHSKKESGGFVADQLFIEVDPPLHIVVGRGAKARGIRSGYFPLVEIFTAFIGGGTAPFVAKHAK